MTIKSPTGRLARWALILQPFNIQIEYKPGKTNVIADPLSRPPCDNTHSEASNCEICSFHIDMPRKNSSDGREVQLNDTELKKIIDCFEGKTDDMVYWTKRGFIMNDGLLYCYDNDDTEDAQLVLPKEERSEILEFYHNQETAGHYGMNRTLHKITSRYYWPGIRKDVEKHVRQCIECQRYKATNLKPAGLYQTVSCNRRFEVVAIDLFGPLPVSPNGFQWIFIVEDIASRWVELFRLEIATAEVCAKTLINEVFLRYGMPRRVISDNGVQFVSAVMQKVMFCFNIQHTLTPVYHPEANPVEREDRDMKAQLAILVGNDHQSYDDKLQSIRFAMNTTMCQSTKYTAAYLTFGRDLRTLDDVHHDMKSIVQSENFVAEITTFLEQIVDVFKNVKESVNKQQDHNKHYSNDRRRAQPNFDVGSKVLITTHVLSKSSKEVTSKFVPKRDGPYIIIERKGNTSYVVAHEDDITIPLGTYHASALTPFVNTSSEPVQPVRLLRRRGRPRK